ncbi:membrane-bound lytic murein transglycosylase MltF [Pseudoalteromonas piscicida]|uniref:membrane-bound lytic murein transglycosylase MltF n=1 Tax=Pseudoalteromonas piscicida TaxID=43662 RepID=UPI0030B36A37
MFKYIFTCFVITFLLGCDKAPLNQLQHIKQNNVLRVGTLAGPGNYYQGTTSEQGYEYELASEFAKELGVELHIVPYFSLDELFTRLNTGDLDIVASAISFHPSRTAQYRFGPTYRMISQKMVYKQGREWPRDFDDIDAPITVLAHSNHVIALEEAKTKHPHLTWEVVSDKGEEELLLAIIDGEIDYTITDSHSLALFRRYHPTVSIAFSVTQDEHVAWMMRNEKDDSLYSLLPPFFARVKQNNFLATLEEKYFGHIEEFNYVNTLAFVEAVHDTLPKYLKWFKSYSKQHNIDWRLLAAVSYQESMWDPRAKSPTGVRGIMMLTQPTAKKVGVTNRLNAQQNIEGGAKYLRILFDRMPEEIQQPDSTWLALASYNVGWGHVRDARNITKDQGGDPNNWADVKKRLPLLTKKRYYRNTRYGYARGDVAVTYVDNIRRYYDALVWLEDNGALLPDSNTASSQTTPVDNPNKTSDVAQQQ